MLRKLTVSVYITFCTIICPHPGLFSQEVITEISNEKIRVEGHTFYLHTVRQGETLYSISKAYGVPEETIQRYNVTTRYQIKSGEVLRIPLLEQEPQEIKQQPETKAYIIHQVQKNETLYSISTRYNVSMNELFEANPFLENGLMEDQLLKIPTQKEITSEVLTDTIIQFDSTSNEPEKIRFECNPSPDIQKTYKIALILPFETDHYIKESNSVDTIYASDGKTVRKVVKRDPAPNAFFNFYDGFLLAVDSLKKLGLKMDITVFDTEKSKWKSGKIKEELEFLKPDLILGPVYTSNIEIISTYSKEYKVPIISPLSTTPELVEDNPYLIQFIPSTEIMNEVSVNYLLNYDTCNMLYFHTGNPLRIDEFRQLRNCLFDSLSLSGRLDSVKFNEVIFNDSVKVNLNKLLSRTKPNLIILPLTKSSYTASRSVEGYASALLGQLYIFRDSCDMILFGTSDFQKFESIDINYFHTLELSIYTPFFIDYSNPDITQFLRKYRNIFGKEPVDFSSKGYNFTFLGYDIGFYFLNALRYFGSDFIGCMEYYRVPLLMGDYTFTRTRESSGFINNSVSIIQYRKNFEVCKIVH